MQNAAPANTTSTISVPQHLFTSAVYSDISSYWYLQQCCPLAFYFPIRIRNLILPLLSNLIIFVTVSWCYNRPPSH